MPLRRRPAARARARTRPRCWTSIAPTNFSSLAFYGEASIAAPGTLRRADALTDPLHDSGQELPAERADAERQSSALRERHPPGGVRDRRHATDRAPGDRGGALDATGRA